MNSRLEKFVTDHREEFDADEPGKKVWEKIQLQLEPGKKKATPLVRVQWIRWSAAAAVIFLIGTGAWLYMIRGTKKNQPDIAGVSRQATGSDAKSKEASNETPAGTPGGTAGAKDPQQAGPDNTGITPATKEPLNLASHKPKDNFGETSEEPESVFKEEMYHYARLVEIKHKELKTIEKDEPLLYKQFAGDVNKLDSIYRTLEHQLPKNPNREQLLEAMVQNLQLQMGLLNHQLTIIKQINHSKKTAYEKAYKTI
ncbi:hypothetical protein ACX0G9_20950 [Flavitalea flava]